MKFLFLKTTILLCLISFFFSLSGFSQLTEPVWKGSVMHSSNTEGIVIDGYDEETFWSESIPVNVLVTVPGDFGGDADLSGNFKMFYTSYAFYFFANITDDITHNYNGMDGNSWAFDNVELFFNIDTTGVYSSGLYSPDGIQLRINRGLDNSNGLPGFGNGEPPKTDFDDPALNYVQIDNAGQWQVELELPWNYMLPSGSKPEDIIEYIGKTIGFDLAIGDSDGDNPYIGARDAMFALDGDGGFGDENNAWHDVRKFGLLELLVGISPVTDANAGEDMALISDGSSEYPVELNGVNSRGKDGSPLEFAWYSLDNIEFDDSTKVKPTVTVPFSGQTTAYKFILQVTDTNDVLDTDTVCVTILNNPPVADAGGNQTVLPVSIVTLDGSGSSDVEPGTLTYTWESLDGIPLSDINSVSTFFIAPDASEDKTYRFILTVNDGEYNSIVSDTVFILIDIVTLAKAGEDMEITSDGSSEYLIELSGENSKGDDGSPLEFAWYSMDNIEFDDSTEVKPTVTVPFSGHTTAYKFVLQVTDTNDVSDTDTVTITILNNPPVADAGDYQVVLPDSLVILDGSSSSDVEPGTLIYTWQSLEGIVLSNVNSVTPTFTAPNFNEDLTFRFKLMVNDGEFDSESDTVSVLVEKYNNIYSNSEDNILISPNPASKYIRIQISNFSNQYYMYSLSDITGRHIYNGEILEANTIINFEKSGIANNGLYYMQIYNSNGMLVIAEKIIVE